MTATVLEENSLLGFAYNLPVLLTIVFLLPFFVKIIFNIIRKIIIRI